MSTATPREIVRPQPGPQEQFLRCTARLVFYGGAAGGGKTYACLLEPLYHIDNPKFEAVIFRRLYREIMAPGGLYRRSLEIYPQLGATFNKSDLIWTFPSGAQVRFAHMQYEEDVESWKSSEIALIEVDEVTEWTEFQFFYMFSRNRSVSGVRPYMRAFCNPDADSWVKSVLAPWVDETWPEGDRAEYGEIRWFVRVDDNIVWCEPTRTYAISVTFIRADLYDNKLLMERDPGYEAGLQALDDVERRRLLDGDWSVRSSGKKFKREWFKILDAVPDDIELQVRFWDKAATEKRKKRSRKNGPDYTAGVLVGRRRKGASPRYIILDALWEQKDPGGVEELIKNTAMQDGVETVLRWEEEGGASGKSDSFNYVTKVLEGFDAGGIRSTGSKEIRANTVSAQAKVGNVGMIRAHWNKAFLNFLVAFPDEAIHDDPVDALSGAFNEIFLKDGDIPFAATVTRGAGTAATMEVARYLPQKGEMPEDEEERLAQRQSQMARVLNQIGGGQYRR